MWLSVRALGSFFTPSSLGRYVEQVVSPEPATITPDEEGESSADNRLLSPVGAVRIASQAADAGVPELLSFLIAINIFIGIFNLVPLLPLDGGHVAIATYERLRSRNGKRYQVDVSKLLPVTYAVVVVLVFLGLTALYLDVTNPIADPFGP
jgi:membrane-associated protease RseP (regulator of RpoE activity)